MSTEDFIIDLFCRVDEVMERASLDGVGSGSSACLSSFASFSIVSNRICSSASCKLACKKPTCVLFG
jgi:hypothetical protein